MGLLFQWFLIIKPFPTFVILWWITRNRREFVYGITCVHPTSIGRKYWTKWWTPYLITRYPSPSSALLGHLRQVERLQKFDRNYKTHPRWNGIKACLMIIALWGFIFNNKAWYLIAKASSSCPNLHLVHLYHSVFSIAFRSILDNNRGNEVCANI